VTRRVEGVGKSRSMRINFPSPALAGLVEGYFCAGTRAGMAPARFLSTWFIANSKRCKSHLPLPDFKRRDSYSDSFVLNNPQGSKGFPSRFPEAGKPRFLL